MHVKKGDTVIIITGSDRGKVGEITKVNSKILILIKKIRLIEKLVKYGWKEPI